MVIFINQIRMKIGVMFGSPETTTGGNALKFYASVRLDIRRIGAIKEGEQVVGNRTRVKVVKNKMAPPFREVEFDILYGQGISREGDIIDLGVEDKVVEKSGAWFSYKGERIGQGRENAKKFLRDNPDICMKIEAEILAKHNIVQNTGTLVAAQNEAAGKGARARPRARRARRSRSSLRLRTRTRRPSRRPRRLRASSPRGDARGGCPAGGALLRGRGCPAELFRRVPRTSLRSSSCRRKTPQGNLDPPACDPVEHARLASPCWDLWRVLWAMGPTVGL